MLYKLSLAQITVKREKPLTFILLFADLSARQQSQHAPSAPANGHLAGGARWNGTSLQPGIMGRAGHPLGDERGRARRRRRRRRQKGKRAAARRPEYARAKTDQRIENRKRKSSEERRLDRIDERG